MTRAQFAESIGLTLSAVPADGNPNMTDAANMDHWTVTLRRGRYSFRLPYSMGVGHHGQPPDMDTVLECLASDASSVGTVADRVPFEEWASEYGYSTDSRAAERTYNAYVRQTKRLASLLGAESYAALLTLDTEA